MVSYTANRIGCETYEGTLIAGIGNEAVGYVMFQRGTTPETDKDEPPYFEYDDQSNGGTEIIESVELFRKLLIVNTDANLAGVERFEITLDIEPEEVEQLSKQLKMMFESRENKLHINAA